MPTYVYQIIHEDGSEGSLFEVVQPMSEEPLTVHPVLGYKVRRVYQSPNLGIKHTPKAEKSRLDTKNVERAGFTKYEKDKVSGKYHKTAGPKGLPDVIDKNKL